MATGLVRRKGRRTHDGDAATALQLLACGPTIGSRLRSHESGERFVAFGYGARSFGVYALTGRGVLAALLSPAVWAEWRARRRTAKAAGAWARLPRLWPLIPTENDLRQARGNIGSEAKTYTPLKPDGTIDVDRVIDDAIRETALVHPITDAADAARLTAALCKPGIVRAVRPDEAAFNSARRDELRREIDRRREARL